MTTRVSVCATIPCRPILSLVARRVVSAISAPDTEPDRRPRDYAAGYDEGYKDGFRDGNEQAFDADWCEQCNDYH